MYMYPSTRTLARSQAPRTFTYIHISFSDMIRDMLTATERYIVPWYSSDYLISYPPPYAVEHYTHSTAVQQCTQLYYMYSRVLQQYPCTPVYNRTTGTIGLVVEHK